MLQNIELTRKIFSASWKVLMKNKSLMVFQFISGMLSTGFVIALIYYSGYADILLEYGFEVAKIRLTADFEENWVVAILILIAVGMIASTIKYFFNVAFVEELLKGLGGKSVSVTRGFKSAIGKLGKILKFSFVVSLVAVVVSIVKDKKGIFRLLGEAMDLGWQLATYFVIPILVIDNLGPIDSIVKSFKLLTKTWGKQIISNFAIGAIFLIPGGIIVAVIVAIGILLAVQVSIAVALVVTVPLTIIVLTIVDLLQSSISQIFTVILYKYVTDGETVAGFDEKTLQSAFAPKTA